MTSFPQYRVTPHSRNALLTVVVLRDTGVESMSCSGTFDYVVGSSDDANSVTLTVDDFPAFCYPVSECCVDKFTICYNGTSEAGVSDCLFCSSLFNLIRI